jgi:hypothetical protein
MSFLEINVVRIAGMSAGVPENVMQANAVQPNSFMSFVEKSSLKNYRINKKPPPELLHQAKAFHSFTIVA